MYDNFENWQDVNAKQRKMNFPFQDENWNSQKISFEYFCHAAYVYADDYMGKMTIFIAIFIFLTPLQWNLLEVRS